MIERLLSNPLRALSCLLPPLLIALQGLGHAQPSFSTYQFDYGTEPDMRILTSIYREQSSDPTSFGLVAVDALTVSYGSQIYWFGYYMTGDGDPFDAITARTGFARPRPSSEAYAFLTGGTTGGGLSFEPQTATALAARVVGYDWWSSSNTDYFPLKHMRPDILQWPNELASPSSEWRIGPAGECEFGLGGPGLDFGPEFVLDGTKEGAIWLGLVSDPGAPPARTWKMGGGVSVSGPFAAIVLQDVRRHYLNRTSSMTLPDGQSERAIVLAAQSSAGDGECDEFEGVNEASAHARFIWRLTNPSMTDPKSVGTSETLLAGSRTMGFAEDYLWAEDQFSYTFSFMVLVAPNDQPAFSKIRVVQYRTDASTHPLDALPNTATPTAPAELQGLINPAPVYGSQAGQGKFFAVRQGPSMNSPHPTVLHVLYTERYLEGLAPRYRLRHKEYAVVGSHSFQPTGTDVVVTEGATEPYSGLAFAPRVVATSSSYYYEWDYLIRYTNLSGSTLYRISRGPNGSTLQQALSDPQGGNWAIYNGWGPRLEYLDRGSITSPLRSSHLMGVEFSNRGRTLTLSRQK